MRPDSTDQIDRTSSVTVVSRGPELYIICRTPFLEVDGTAFEEQVVFSGDESPRSCCKLDPIVAIQNKNAFCLLSDMFQI